MKYTDCQIRALADEFIREIENDEFTVATLPNDAEPYYKERMQKDSLAIQNVNVKSLFFQAMYEA